MTTHESCKTFLERLADEGQLQAYNARKRLLEAYGKKAPEAEQSTEDVADGR